MVWLDQNCETPDFNEEMFIIEQPSKPKANILKLDTVAPPKKPTHLMTKEEKIAYAKELQQQTREK